MSIEQKADISTPCLAYNMMAEKWKLPRTLMGGTIEMRKAGMTYLPIEPKESIIAYEGRLSKTTLYNTFKRAVTTQNGKLMERGIHLEEDVPPQLMDIMEDVDMEGNDVTQFCNAVMFDAMIVGHSHILVDFPETPEGVVSVADEKAAGVRPYWVNIKAENLIFWSVARVGSSMQLTEIRFRENTVEADGEWGQKTVCRIRRLRPGSWELWEERETNGKKVWMRIKQGVTTLDFIPLVTVYANRTGFMESEPLFEDLARLNVAHWQSSSDQRHILHVARVPILFASGLEDDDSKPQEIGMNRLFKAPTGADMKYVEHQGHAIAAGANDLKSLEEQMDVMAMQPTLTQKTGNQTATGRALDSAEAQSTLLTIASQLEDSVEQALQFTGAWLKIAKEQCGGVCVDPDFNLSNQEVPELNSLEKARDRKDISRIAYTTELKRRSILSEEYDAEADLELIDQEVPPLGTSQPGMVSAPAADQSGAAATKCNCPNCGGIVPKGEKECPECNMKVTDMPKKADELNAKKAEMQGKTVPPAK